MEALPAHQCVGELVAEAQRLGVEVRWQPRTSLKADAVYYAPPGRPGLLVIRAGESAPANAEICTLLSHEMVHVLQHWNGRLQAITPLGWPTDEAPPHRTLSRHEAEAYTAQKHPLRVLKAVRELHPHPSAP